MKKVAFVTRVISSGGAENVLRQIVNACAEQGMECTVFTTWKNTYSAKLPESVKLIELQQAGDGLKGKFIQYGQLRKLICEEGCDLVLSMPEDIGIYVIAAMLGTGIPVVVSERNNPWVMPNKKATRILRRMLYPFAKGLIFQTKQAASFFPKSQQKKGIVLPNPLDCSRLPTVYQGEREKVVVSAGRLADQKNFPLLIEAFALFRQKHPDYKLVIYGEGDKRKALEALAGEKLPEGSWSMPGRVDDLPKHIGKCGIFALSSDYEGVPNVLIEALAVGTPSVSTDCAPGGAAELIENGKNGILVPVGDANALAEGLCFMAEHSAEAAQMAAEAVKIRERLNAKKVTADWLEYLALCAGAKKG